ncbi:MAG: M48 family metalloprotease [Acidobacteriota bacterium]|jgi:predicted Zn-dependent protease|nr:M48 family metalloprotease [Acidobacteriota bacterium]
MKTTSVRITVFLLIVAMSAMSVSSAVARKHEDVENIGNRGIAGGRVYGIFPNMVSLEKEIELGQEVAAEFEQTAQLLDDPVVNEYVDRIAQNIVKHSDAKVPFHVKVVDTDEVNAFAFPGGFFYVNKGLILAADNESELAGVMAHEISHVTARHATMRMSKGQYLQLAAIPAMIFGGYWAQMAMQNGLGLGINLELLGVTRDSEREADQLGIQYLWNAGYDPNSFVSFFEKLQAEEKDKPGRLAGWFRTHPSTDDRIIAALDEQRYLPEKENYIVNTSEFDRIKMRVQAFDNAQKDAAERDPNEPKRPTLKRRTETGAPNPDDPDGGGIDGAGEEPSRRTRPTLRRPGDETPD